MLDTNIKTQLKEYFKNLTIPVTLRLKLDDGAKSVEMKSFAEDVCSISENLSLHSQEALTPRAPSVELYSGGEFTGVTFSGLPMGHEFNSFILAVLQAGGHPSKIDAETIATIKALQGPLDFTTYISLSCQNCPEVVQALNAMSLFNPGISHTMVDGALFQEETEANNIMAVPTVYLNGEEFSQGRQSLAEIIAKLDKGSATKNVEKLNQKATFDMLVVGGGPAGAAAAIYAARKGINTGLVADRFGGQVQDTIAIENFISVKATEGPKLVAGLENHVKDYPVDLMTNQKAAGLEKKEVFEVALESGATLKAKTVLIATGARWREIGVPGEKEFKGRGVAYCPHCDGPFFKGKDVAVIGGGNSGVEAAIDLAGIVSKVTLIEFGTSLRADKVLQDKLRSLPNVTILVNAATTEILGDEKGVHALTYKDRATNEEHKIALSGVFVQIGLVPNSEWLHGVEKTKFGEIITNDKGATSLEGVFAAGDVTNVPFKQIIIAMGEGAKASLGAFDYLIRQ